MQAAVTVVVGSLLAVVAVIGGLADSVERTVYMPDGSDH